MTAQCGHHGGGGAIVVDRHVSPLTVCVRTTTKASRQQPYYGIWLHQNTTGHMGKAAQIVTWVVTDERGAARHKIVSPGKCTERAVCDEDKHLSIAEDERHTIALADASWSGRQRWTGMRRGFPLDAPACPCVAHAPDGQERWPHASQRDAHAA